MSAPNKIETAQALSKLAGETTVRHSHRMVSSGGTSVSEPEVGRSLITPDEVRRLGTNEVLIFTRGYPAATRAQRLQYHKQKLFQRRAAIKAPKASDRSTTAPPANAAEQSGEDPTFLRFGANLKNKKELV